MGKYKHPGLRVLAAYVIGLGGFSLLTYILLTFFPNAGLKELLLWFIGVVFVCSLSLVAVDALKEHIAFLSGFTVWAILLAITYAYGHYLLFLLILAIPVIPVILFGTGEKNGGGGGGRESGGSIVKHRKSFLTFPGTPMSEKEKKAYHKGYSDYRRYCTEKPPEEEILNYNFEEEKAAYEKGYNDAKEGKSERAEW
jgi:hypothetical protein